MIPAAHVIFVLDDSGSMRASKDITKKSFDGMIDALQLCKGADIVMTLLKYGSTVKTEFSRKHIQEVMPIGYDPNSGQDVIYDSMVYAIDLADKAPRDERTIIILQADAGDTSSYSKPEDVFKAVSVAKKNGVEFLFLGANYNGAGSKSQSEDAMAPYLAVGSAHFIRKIAGQLGFAPDEVILYDSGTAKESLAAFEETASNIGAVASRTTDHAAYTKEQQSRVRKE